MPCIKIKPAYYKSKTMKTVSFVSMTSLIFITHGLKVENKIIRNQTKLTPK